MANISEHDAEQKRKCRDCEECWIDFLISRDSVGVDDLLEWPSEIVQIKVGWSFRVRHQRLCFLELPKWHNIATSLSNTSKSNYNTLFFTLPI